MAALMKQAIASVAAVLMDSMSSKCPLQGLTCSYRLARPCALDESTSRVSAWMLAERLYCKRALVAAEPCVPVAASTRIMGFEEDILQNKCLRFVHVNVCSMYTFSVLQKWIGCLA